MLLLLLFPHAGYVWHAVLPSAFSFALSCAVTSCGGHARACGAYMAGEFLLELPSDLRQVLLGLPQVRVCECASGREGVAPWSAASSAVDDGCVTPRACDRLRK